MKYWVLLKVVSTRSMRRSAMPSRSPVQGRITSVSGMPSRPLSIGACALNAAVTHANAASRKKTLVRRDIRRDSSLARHSFLHDEGEITAEFAELAETQEVLRFSACS